jgi:hypothetical protein
VLNHRRGDVWACNWSLQYLLGRGDYVTHGVAVDGTLGMLKDWPHPYPVSYLLASSVHPDLVRSLAGRPVTFFHSYRGFPGETELYQYCWPSTVRVGLGLTVVPRAVALAIWMGYRRITVLGADCALGPNDAVRPNGQTPKEAYGGDPLIFRGARFGGRPWNSLVDLIESATSLRRAADMWPKVRLIGDTLPNALKGWSSEAMYELIRVGEDGRVTVFATRETA